jgi:hypothetical protein
LSVGNTPWWVFVCTNLNRLYDHGKKGRVGGGVGQPVACWQASPAVAPAKFLGRKPLQPAGQGGTEWRQISCCPHLQTTSCTVTIGSCQFWIQPLAPCLKQNCSGTSLAFNLCRDAHKIT